MFNLYKALDGGAPHNSTVMDMENNKNGRTIAGGLGQTLIEPIARMLSLMP